MTRGLMCVIVLFLLASMGIAGQTELVQASIEPDEAAIGDTVTVKAVFTGEQEDISKVTLYVREYRWDAPEYSLYPDTTAEKNVWILQGPIPNDAPVGETLNLDFTAIDKEGKEIVNEEMPENAVGETGTMKITIK